MKMESKDSSQMMPTSTATTTTQPPTMPPPPPQPQPQPPTPQPNSNIFVGRPSPSAAAAPPMSGMQLSFDHHMAPPPPPPQQQKMEPTAMMYPQQQQQQQVNMGELMRKKRGRPRKYSTPDGNMALALAPISSASAVAGGGYSNSPLSDPANKRRGRPPGSGKKKQFEALGSWGIGFTPHILTVKAGEDVASKIMAFSQQGPRTVCVLSANGAISNVTLRQPATSGGLVTYEGRFEFISLSGSFLLAEDGDTRSRTGGLSVALAGFDGRVLGGCVAGMLMASTPVQVVVASFIAEGKKSRSEAPKREPMSAPPQMASFAPALVATPPSDGTSSESSDDSASPPMNHSGPAPGYNNSGHHMHPAYPPGGWSLSGHQNRHDSDMKMMSN